MARTATLESLGEGEEERRKAALDPSRWLLISIVMLLEVVMGNQEEAEEMHSLCVYCSLD